MKKTLYLLAASLALAVSAVSFAHAAATHMVATAAPAAAASVSQSSDAVATVQLESTGWTVGHVYLVGDRQADALDSGGAATRRPVQFMATAAPLAVNWRSELPRYSG